MIPDVLADEKIRLFAHQAPLEEIAAKLDANPEAVRKRLGDRLEVDSGEGFKEN